MKAKPPNDERELILGTVRRFVEKEVIPVASAMEHRDEYPYQLVAQMKEIGLFGLNVPRRVWRSERRDIHSRDDLRRDRQRLAGPLRRGRNTYRDVRRDCSVWN